MLSREEKHILEIESILDTEENGVAELGAKQLKKILKEYKRTYKQLNKIIRISDRQQDELNLKSQKVKSLLNNADQGFLSFGLDCVVDEEYSQECVKLLGAALSGKDIADLLYPNDLKKKHFFKETLVNVHNEDNDMIKDVMLSLLPSELRLNRRAIKIDYKIINDHKYMIVLTNITKEKILERKIKREQEILKMIVNIVSDPTQFYELKDDYLAFSANKDSLLNSNVSFATNLSQIYRDIHTFKGSFGQLRMQGCVKKLHDLEEVLSTLKSSGKKDNSTLLTLLENSDFSDWMQSDLQIIQKILGEDFFEKQHMLVVDDTFMLSIEEKITRLLHFDNQHVTTYENILSEINKARGTTISQALSSYPRLCKETAESLGKNIHEFKICGGEDILMPLHFKPFLKSLIHVFRNAISHGVEDAETRLAAGKNEIAMISCHVEKHSESMVITIADDGSGIDTLLVQQKALTAQKVSKEDLVRMSEADILELIFHEGVSTNDSVDELSGRGIGMNAVKQEVDKLSGSIRVESQTGKGTHIILSVPTVICGDLINIASNAKDTITIDFIVSPIVSRVGSYLQNDMKINLNRKANITYTTVDTIELKNFTSCIHISGLVDVSICMSCDLFLLDRLLERFSPGENIVESDLPEYRKSVSMEVLNIVVGNALVNSYDSTILQITTPFVTECDELHTHDGNEKIAHISVDTECGEMQVLVGCFC